MNTSLMLLIAAHLIGLGTALVVVALGHHKNRGAISWVLALLLMPWLAVPVYWLAGGTRFVAYRKAQAAGDTLLARELADSDAPTLSPALRNIAAYSCHPATAAATGATLLTSATDTYAAIEDAIRGAEHYVLITTYILRSDQIGEQLADELKAAAARGIDVFLLYDELGSRSSSRRFFRDLRDAGVSVQGFTADRRLLSSYRLNFRNHRKITVVDGKVGFLGGMNFGVEYLAGDDKLSSWRDTHLRLAGNPALALQHLFYCDWVFATKQEDSGGLPMLQWTLEPALSERQHLICGLGPHQRSATGDVLYHQLVAEADRRLWIATPYFVPDDNMIVALRAAALRGVEVRVLVPLENDHPSIHHVHLALLAQLVECGIEVWLYQRGFMHQKVMLIDDDLAVLGSANFDNRSLRLNFEVVNVSSDPTTCRQVEDMLRKDFSNSKRRHVEAFHELPWTQRLISQGAALFAPVL